MSMYMSHDMWYDSLMRTKRSYNLSAATIATVKRLVEVDHVAATQDALVEQAIAELDRVVQDAHDAQAWSDAARDEEFQAEIARFASDFPPEDPAIWE